MLGNNLNDIIGTIEISQKMLQIYYNSPYYKNSKNLQIFPKNPWKSKQWVQQQQPNQRLQPPKITTGVSAIAVPQEKLSCNKVGTTTSLKFQQEIIPILKKDIQNFRGGNFKNQLAKWKNITSDKIILNIVEK